MNIPADPPPAEARLRQRSETARSLAGPAAQMRARLLISIPALMVCFTVGVGVICYQIFMTYDASIKKGLSPASTSPSGAVSEGRISRTPPSDWAETWLLITIVGGAMLAATSGYLMARAIVTPLRAISRRLEEIASVGPMLEVTQSLSAPPEIDQLSQRFSKVLESLRSYVRQRDSYIMECFTGGLMLIDSAGLVTTMNSAAEKMMLAGPSDLVGAELEGWLRRNDPKAPLAGIIADAREYAVMANSRETYIINAQGERVPILATINPLQHEGERPVGYSINFRDLRNLKQFYEQMQRADRLAAIGTFAAGIAHELRNPLGAIKGITQLLAEDLETDSQAQRYTETIIRQVNRLDKVVRNVLDFAQPVDTPLDVVDLNALVRETVALCRNAVWFIDAGPITVTESYGDIGPARVQGDRIHQALINLLRNAVEATPSGGAISVTTTTARDDQGQGWCEIAIANTGETISPDAMLHLFEPFFSTKEQGTGLGLAITSQILTTNGGDIRAHSESGLTTFVIRLPTGREAAVPSAV